VTSTSKFDPAAQLKGKTVVIIGGSSGIGLEVGVQARALGARLVLVGRSADKLKQAAARVGEGTTTFVGDAHDHSKLEDLFGRLPPFDHLVSLVGDTMAGGYLDAPLEVMRHVIESKFWTNLLIGRLAAKRVRDGGSLVFTSGIGARAHEASASYTANAALSCMVEGMASELAPRVRVNVVAPSFMDTALWRDSEREYVARRKEGFAAVAALKRTGTPEETAQAYVFLMTNTFSTGQTLKIDGGVMLRK
jgi:NAD(P)-dependent dehydrogenase (short-subunit alcohol dehydrogenase family)